MSASIDGTHCESCGRHVDPFRCEDGYTACCNERVCYGDTAVTWAIADGAGNQVGQTNACCAAAAERYLEGETDQYLSHRIVGR